MQALGHELTPTKILLLRLQIMSLVCCIYDTPMCWRYFARCPMIFFYQLVRTQNDATDGQGENVSEPPTIAHHRVF